MPCSSPIRGVARAAARISSRPVLGDMGGGDVRHLSGLDHLVAKGSPIRERLGIMGGSYGGFMPRWLDTQDARFAAAVPVAPVDQSSDRAFDLEHPALR